jgi:hypothetical protein
MLKVIATTKNCSLLIYMFAFEVCISRQMQWSILFLILLTLSFRRGWVCMIVLLNKVWFHLHLCLLGIVTYHLFSVFLLQTTEHVKILFQFTSVITCICSIFISYFARLLYSSLIICCCFIKHIQVFHAT